MLNINYSNKLKNKKFSTAIYPVVLFTTFNFKFDIF